MQNLNLVNNRDTIDRICPLKIIFNSCVRHPPTVWHSSEAEQKIKLIKIMEWLVSHDTVEIYICVLHILDGPDFKRLALGVSGHLKGQQVFWNLAPSGSLFHLHWQQVFWNQGRLKLFWNLFFYLYCISLVVSNQLCQLIYTNTITSVFSGICLSRYISIYSCTISFVVLFNSISSSVIHEMDVSHSRTHIDISPADHCVIHYTTLISPLFCYPLYIVVWLLQSQYPMIYGLIKIEYYQRRPPFSIIWSIHITLQKIIYWNCLCAMHIFFCAVCLKW